MRNVWGEGAVPRCTASEWLRRTSQQKRKGIRGQTQTVLEHSLQPGADAPDVCYVAIVLVTVAAQSDRPRETFLGYSILWLFLTCHKKVLWFIPTSHPTPVPALYRECLWSLKWEQLVVP